MPQSGAAIHARVAMAKSTGSQQKKLVISPSSQDRDAGDNSSRQIIQSKPDVREARQLWAGAISAKPEISAESLGHVDTKTYADDYSNWLADQGDTQEAAKVQQKLYDTFKAQRVLPRVL